MIGLHAYYTIPTKISDDDIITLARKKYDEINIIHQVSKLNTIRYFLEDLSKNDYCFKIKRQTY